MLYKIYNSILTILVNTGSDAEVEGLTNLESYVFTSLKQFATIISFSLEF